MSTQRHFFQGDTRSSSDGNGRPDSSWISVFSKPAWSFLQRYFPGRAPNAFELTSHIDIGNSLSPLNVAYLHCQSDGAARSTPGDPLAWFTQESLSEMGIQNTSKEDFTLQKQRSAGYVGTTRNVLSQVFLSPQEKRSAKPVNKYELDLDGLSARGSNSWWLSGILETNDITSNFLLNLKQSKKQTDTKWQHCGAQQSVCFCKSGDGSSIHNESPGPLCSKELNHNAPLNIPEIESLSSSYQLPVAVGQQLLVCCSAYSEKAILTSDQDNGYSSLEEECLSRLHMKLLSTEQEVSETTGLVVSEEDPSPCTSTEGEPHCPLITSEEELKEQGPKETENTNVAAEDEPILATPQCQNKVIAYIMGGPCSDDSESEDVGEDWDSDDDDGFDSEGSSHFSESEDDSDDESDEDSDEEVQSETERLWNALCQNGDPYNPRNFSAPLRTAPKPNLATPDSSVSGSPPAHESSQGSPPSSSPTFSENESSEEACEMDEEESHRLWNSFSCAADPYSLFNFQAPLQTQKACKGSHKEKAARCKRDEAEERLDSGFSEIAPMPCSSSATVLQLKKVTFVEEVEEFYASSDEDRHGPWEEFARDRCRFQRRVHEVEETISFCLSPSFRLDIFQRLHTSC